MPSIQPHAGIELAIRNLQEGTAADVTPLGQFDQ